MSLTEVRTLHERLIDSVDGYENAREAAKENRFAALFATLAEERRSFAAEVRSALTGHGEEVDDDGSILAAAHRMFVDLKVMAADDDEALLESVISGEEKVMEAYNEAVESNAPDEIKNALVRQRTVVAERLKAVRAMEERID